ncbi:MAG: class I SAM-dependent RNA methyltransferase [Spirochaetota bacterium]
MIVRIEKFIHGGFGLAREEGKNLLVPFSVPGDVLEVECIKQGEVSQGLIKSIVEPSLHRVQHRCPVFGICGGCDFDHIDYDFELEVKKAILFEDLQRIAKLADVRFDRCIRSPDPYNYRNHAQFKVSDDGRVGFFMKRSNDVIGLPELGCLLVDENINGYMLGIVRHISFHRGGFRVRCNERGEIFQKGIPGIVPDRYCYHYIKGKVFRVDIDGFFQVNKYLIPAWLDLIVEYSKPQRDDRVLDLYCGSGIIGLSLAEKVKTVTGVEIDKKAVESAIFNRKENRVENISFLKGDALDAMEGLGDVKHIEKIIVDPPRAGMGKNVVEKIAMIEPELLVYASCDTATLARDIRFLMERGYYLSKVSLVDMFPRTQHIETVSLILKE